MSTADTCWFIFVVGALLIAPQVISGYCISHYGFIKRSDDPLMYWFGIGAYIFFWLFSLGVFVLVKVLPPIR
jgi:hypothetical protein